MARDYRVISADAHLDLNPEVWTHRVPAKWRDRALSGWLCPMGRMPLAAMAANQTR